MKASHVLGALALAGASLATPAQALVDADLLYCAQVYAEAGTALRADPDPGVRRTARDALARSRPLGARDIDLLNDDPARHKRASAHARQRLAAMPSAPPEARRLALRAAFLECRQLEAGAIAPPPAAPADTGAPLSPSAGIAEPAPAAATTGAAAPAAASEASDPGVTPAVAAPAAAAIASSPVAATAALPAAAATPLVIAPTLRAEEAAPRSGTGGNAIRRLWRALAGKPRTEAPASSVSAITPAPGAAASGAPDIAPPSGPGQEDTHASGNDPVPVPVSDAIAAAAPSSQAREDDADILATVLAAALRPAGTRGSAPDGLGDADLLYCAQVYAEAGALLGQDRNAARRRMAEDAQRRWQALSERDYNLLNEDPQRHARASAAAESRLAMLPARPASARRAGLRKAYAECRDLQEGKADSAAALPAKSRHQAEAVAPRASEATPARPAAPVPRQLPVTAILPAAAPAPAPSSASSPAAVAAPAPARSGLDDVDLLYCEQVYGEIAATLGDSDGEAAEAARDAGERWRPLNERDYDLLNENPARHSRASATVRQRLSTLPQRPGRARSVALRAAYEECRGLEDRSTAAATPVAGADRVRMQANRHFCRDLLLTRLKVSPKLRAGFSPNELAALDEIQKIGEALTRPLPGAALTLEQDREANQLMVQLRETLDVAVANWKGGTDPVVQAMGQCHEDYVQGLLGGPDVLNRGAEDAPSAEAAVTTVAPAPVVRLADLGPVFHMREMTPVGNFDGIWVRRGRTNIYDAVWVNAANGQMQRDVLELRGIIDGELTVYRQSYHGSYRARVRANGTLAPGTASWFNSAAYGWNPLPPQYVRAATGDLGAIVHMREVTPYGNYDGIWRQRGQTGVYDALWVFLPTGDITADVLVVAGVTKGQLVIRRQNGPGIYPLKRRADNMAYKDPAKGGKIMSKWEVVPAQPVRLGE